MANQREVFTIVEDKTTAGLGVALKGKVVGDAVADVQMPALVAEDFSGNEAKIPLGPDGGVLVSEGLTGQSVHDSGVATPVGLATDTDVAVITLTASEMYRIGQFHGSSLQRVLWTIIQTDDVTDTELARWVSGPGSFGGPLSGGNCIEFTAGATGTQELKVVGNQISGPVSDMHGYICAREI